MCVTGGGGRDGLGRGHGRGSSLWWRPRVGGVRPHSLWWARQASGMCDGDGTAMCEDGGRVHMYGARIRPVRPPHRAARQDRARRARPRRRLRHLPVRPADERLADRNPRSLLAGLAGTVRRVGGPAHEPMPAGRDRPTGQARPRRVHRVRRTSRRRWRSGPGHRRCAPPDLPARWRGGTALGRGHRGARAPATPPPVLVAEARGPPLR